MIDLILCALTISAVFAASCYGYGCRDYELLVNGGASLGNERVVAVAATKKWLNWLVTLLLAAIGILQFLY